MWGPFLLRLQLVTSNGQSITHAISSLWHLCRIGKEHLLWAWRGKLCWISSLARGPRQLRSASSHTHSLSVLSSHAQILKVPKHPPNLKGAQSCVWKTKAILLRVNMVRSLGFKARCPEFSPLPGRWPWDPGQVTQPGCASFSSSPRWRVQSAYSPGWLWGQNEVMCIKHLASGT